MSINLEWLDACNELRNTIEQSQGLLSRMETPYLTDKSLIHEVHTLLQSYLTQYDKSTAIRAEMLILLYLFAPSRLIQQKQGRFQIMTDIANAMGLNRNNACMYKVTLIDFYRLYKDFRAIVDGGMQIVKDKYARQGDFV